MDETRQGAARAAARRPWRADSPPAGRPGGNRWGARPELRVSDAERDAVVTELGEHFGQGRLDQAEFDERATRALSARTGRDLGGLLADLPPARAESSTPQPGARLPGTLILVPLLVAAMLIAGIAAGGASPVGGLAAVVAGPGHGVAVQLVAPRPAGAAVAVTSARKSSPAAAPSGSSGNSLPLPGGAACRLTAGQRARPRAALDQGPAACRRRQEQRRTLARVTTLIGRLFRLR